MFMEVVTIFIPQLLPPPFLAPTVTSQTNMKDVPTLKFFSNGKTERQRLGQKLLLKFHTLLYFYLWTTRIFSKVLFFSN